jgi:ATP-dependent DNA helicase RecQ
VVIDAGLVRAALATIRRMGGRLGAANLAAVLGGRETKWVREHEWAREVASFGALRDWQQERIRLLLAELVEAGLAAPSPGEYPTLGLTKTGLEALENRIEVEVRLPASAHPEEGGWGAVDGEIFEKLKRWRLATARKEGVPAFRVFSDRTLQELSVRRPSDRAALLHVPGVGPAKLAAYADELLRLLQG